MQRIANLNPWLRAIGALTAMAIVLLITSSSGPSHVVVRYAGCNHHGIDDGTQLRHLTADSIAPLITEPTAVWQAVGSEMGEILFPDTAEHRSEDG